MIFHDRSKARLMVVECDTSEAVLWWWRLCFWLPPRMPGVLSSRYERAKYKTRHARECHGNVNRFRAGKLGLGNGEMGRIGGWRGEGCPDSRRRVPQFRAGRGAGWDRVWIGMRQVCFGGGQGVLKKITCHD
jgi:hypothetical protein